jgi:hypothetical protein
MDFYGADAYSPRCGGEVERNVRTCVEYERKSMVGKLFKKKSCLRLEFELFDRGSFFFRKTKKDSHHSGRTAAARNYGSATSAAHTKRAASCLDPTHIERWGAVRVEAVQQLPRVGVSSNILGPLTHSRGTVPRRTSSMHRRPA